MEITWTHLNKRVACTLPFDNCTHVEAASGKCPSCGASPLKLHATQQEVYSFDTYRGIARCACCNAKVGGHLEVRIDTLFGIEEDERVIHGRCRVY